MILLLAAYAADPCAGVMPCSIVKTEELKLPAGRPPARVHELDRGPSTENRCTNRAWVLEAATGLRTILEVCNDGYGASGVGEDDIRIDGNRFLHSQNGGSSWRWGYTNTLELDPPRRVTWSDVTSFIGLNELARSWSFESGSGTYSSSFERCEGSEGAPASFDGPLLPWLAAPAGFDWRTKPLGTCGLTVDSATGPLAHGAPGVATDAIMKVVLLGDALVVEVTDDLLVEQAKSWIKQDHLEIWWTSGDRMNNGCLETAPALQWGVLLDGKVEVAHGAPAPLTVESIAFAGGRRWRITGLDTEHMAGLTVVYSDTDDGQKQERLLATSPLRFGDALSLGLPFKPRDTACVVTERGLELRYTPNFPVDRPLLEPDGSR